MHKNARRNTKILDILITTLILAIIITTVVFLYLAISEDNFDLRIAEAGTGITYSVLCVAFGITGFLSISKLKFYFPDFYKENRCTLLFAVTGQSLSLMFRGVIDSLRFIERENKDFNKTFFAYINLFNVLILICCDLTPLIF